MPGFARRFAAIMDRVSVFIGYACAVLLMLCIGLSVFEVFMRYALNRPTPWTFETVMVLCATAWVMSSGYVTQRRRHIAITTLELFVSAKVWRVFELIASLVAVFALAVLIWASWDPAHMAWVTMEKSGSAFNPPSPVYLKTALIAGASLYLLQLLANIIHWFAPPDDDSTPARGGH